MDLEPETAAIEASNRYGTREKIAFTTLGTRPLDLLMDSDEPMSVHQVISALEQQEEDNVQRWAVERYFKVLEDYDIVDYDDNGDLFQAWNKSVARNGTGYEEFERFVDRYETP